jgi:hypothetical protein
MQYYQSLKTAAVRTKTKIEIADLSALDDGFLVVETVGCKVVDGRLGSLRSLQLSALHVQTVSLLFCAQPFAT